MDISGIRDFVRGDLEKVRSVMSRALESDVELLDSANKFVFSNSGKALRPILALLVARLKAKEAGPDTVNFAAAAELLHNATLLHDDVVDASGERRGKPTVYATMGGTLSVLIGDFWLVKAMERMMDSPKGNSVIRIFAKSLSDLAEGELFQQMKALSCDTVESDCLRIIDDKTGSLFVATAAAAAISVDASEEETAAVTDYALNLGRAFQIKDDIFDYSDGAQIGKPVGGDILERKITMPLICALDSVDAEGQARVREMVRGILAHPEDADRVRLFVREHDGLALAGRKMDAYISKAREALDAFAPSQAKDCLSALAGYVGERVN